MGKHGFGEGTVHSKKATKDELNAIAACISNIEGIRWAHVVKARYTYDQATLKWRKDDDVTDLRDIVWEMTHKFDGDTGLHQIKQCAIDNKHTISINRATTFWDDSFEKGKKKIHPKEKEETSG